MEEGSTEEGSNEVPLESEAQPAEYNVSEGDPVKGATNQPPAPDIFIIPESTDEPDNHSPPEPLTAAGHDHEETLPEDSAPMPCPSPPPTPAPSRPVRDRRPPDMLNLYSVFHITAWRALREDPATVRPAIEAELNTLISKGVFRPVQVSTLTPTQRAGI